MCRVFLVLCASAVTLAGLGLPTSADEPSHRKAIELPARLPGMGEVKVEAKLRRVGVRSTVSVAAKEGLNVVGLVRPVVSEDEWYLQEPLTFADGRYSGVIRFGNSKTPDGVCFEYVIAVVPNDYHYFAGDLVNAVPEGSKELHREVVSLRKTAVVPRVAAPAEPASAETKVVVEEKPAASATQTDRNIILSPVMNDQVQAQHSLIARRVRGRTPIVVVRPVGEKTWYVQPIVGLQETRFASTVRFGNERTPEGTKFEVSVVLFKKNPGWQPGDAIQQLPKDAEVSRTILVERAAPLTASRP